MSISSVRLFAHTIISSRHEETDQIHIIRDAADDWDLTDAATTDIAPVTNPMHRLQVKRFGMAPKALARIAWAVLSSGEDYRPAVNAAV